MSPEFDHEVISSVLYYIYNGQVVMPARKLKMFSDTANSMNVFVDQQYIYKKNHCEEFCHVPKKGEKTLPQENYNIPYLKFLKRNIGCYSYIERDIAHLVHEMKNTVGSLKLPDNTMKLLCRWSEENYHDARSLTSISEFRHRQSLQPDIFIETYRGFSNSLDQMPCMRAVSNKNDRAFTSIADANRIHSSTSQILPDNKNYSLFNNFKQAGRHDDNYRECKRKIPYSVCNQLKANSFCTSKCPKECKYAILNTLDNIAEQGICEDMCLMKDSICTRIESSHTIAKVTILNKVLQSPWRPQQPNSYKPFKKIIRNHFHSENQQDSKVFSRKEDYDVHIRKHSPITQYSCEECNKTFSQLRNYKYHMSVHRGTKEFAATCSVCGKHFNDKGYLSNHMKIHRNRKEYKCEFCPKSFNQRVAFNMHVRIHTGVKPHVCDECGKAFSRKMLLKQHQRIHSGERPYACTYCNRRFADRSNMTLHLRLHTGVKPYSCTMCPKSFTKKHHLKSHLNFHTGEKPYSCPRCKLAFTQSSNMRTHMKKCNADTQNIVRLF